MLQLIEPTTSLYTEFQDCHADWGPGLHEDGFGIEPTDEINSSAGFTAWVDRMLRQHHPAAQPCPDHPHGSHRWIVSDGRVLGGIAIRHHDDALRGHIGYGVRPTARRRGVATWALREMLHEARHIRGLNRVLLVCAADNHASAHTIERCGGALESIRDGDFGPHRRYWINLPHS
ncbi:GNAT family N-acetyltransferase [Streptomyces hygroscopicus]|uniref:GNAT family N-acetyltransferase n=1 Tax=Streptomyces hygroscopicus TaxID=1912 RepID=UPI00369FFC20